MSVVSENREYIKLLLQYHIFFVKNELAQCKTRGTIAPERYHYIQTVIKVHNTLPVSTATVERGFSAMNRILSYARNSLTTQLASDLIRLSLITKDILIVRSRCGSGCLGEPVI